MSPDEELVRKGLNNPSHGNFPLGGVPPPSAAKLAALSWDPENLKKLSLNAYLQIFATKMPYLQVFATKIALLNYMTKTQCLALIFNFG